LTLEVTPGVSVALAKEIVMKTAIFKIEGMHCDGCANTIETLVGKEPGVRLVSVSFAECQARVLYDPQAVGEERLVKAIQKPGFRVVGRAGEEA
jgi:copper chaperone CopZ